MSKRKITFELYSYGIYSEWQRDSSQIPKLLEITNRIPVREGVEFGYVLNIKGAKGRTLNYRIDHPVFLDGEGMVAPPFEGEYFINSNDYAFFLGDTVWLPLEDKAGEWILTTWLDGKLLASKKLLLYLE